MPINLVRQWFLDLAELRYAATPKRLRAYLDGRKALDTREAPRSTSLAVSSPGMPYRLETFICT